MIAIRFDVNDEKNRASFFGRCLGEAVDCLDVNTQALWGNMTPQHMIEHLVWAFQCSTGALVLRCHTPEQLLERAKRFLYDNRPTPRGFRNPELGEIPPAYQCASLQDARTWFNQELVRFSGYYQSHPKAVHVHPIFGPLGKEEWERSHFKHCCHHLLQFGLIGGSESPGR